MDKNTFAMIVLGAVFLLVDSVASDKIININTDTDKELNIMNKKLTDLGQGLQPMPDIRLPRVRLSKGIQYGLNSINRTADCTVTLMNNGSVYADYHIGYRLLVFAFGKIAIQNGDEMSGSSRIRKNSAHISYTVSGLPRKCNLTLGYHRFDEMTDADFQASLPEYDGLDASRFISTVFLTYINQKMKEARGLVEKMLQNQICPEDGNPMVQSEMLTKTLKVFVGLNVFSRLHGQVDIEMDPFSSGNHLL